MTTHLAWMPHVPGQGSLHFWLIQASFGRQSELRVHSGRHRGGDPRNSGAHVHTACSFNSRHMLFGPQGFGLHGLVTGETIRERYIVACISSFDINYLYKKILYLSLHRKKWTRFRWYRKGSCTSVCDLSHYINYFVHKYLDRDLRIYFVCMLYRRDNPN